MKNRFWTIVGSALMGVGIVGIVLTAYAANERLKRDSFGNPVMGAVTDDANLDIKMLRVDPVTGELLTKSSSTSVGGATSVNQILILAQIAAGQASSEPVVIVVGDTPTLLFSASSTRRAGFIQNAGITPVFLGKSAVTTGTGEILAGSNVANDGLGGTAKAEHGDAVFAIAATGTTVNVRVSEVSN